MSSIDVDSLLAEVSSDSPCGEDLSYDAAYAELEAEIKGTPERQVGDAIVPAEDPDWRDIKQRSLDLFARSKDLRVAIDLTLALMQIEGLSGLRDGLAVVNGLVEKYWDTFFPQLDPDDNNDPTERMNIVSSLAPESSYQDPLRFPQRLLEVPLVSSPQMGRFGLRQVLLANGELTASGDEAAPDVAQIDAAFATAKGEEIAANAAAIGEAQELLGKINSALEERVGPTNVPNLDKFTVRVKQIRQLFDQKAPGGAGTVADAGAEAAAGAGGVVAQRGPGLSGGISTRGEVVKALDMITNYYRRHEPSSPVPLLMQRARRMVEKNFMEIMQDMTPDSIQQVQTILGTEEGSTTE